ncbi:MAG: ABC transporter permease [Haliscomenobacter sp.]
MWQVGQLVWRRILFAVPTLLVVSVIAFGLSKAAPGDPVQQLLHRTGEESLGNWEQEEKSYRETARILDLDKPAFYCAFLPIAYPDTLYKMAHPVRRAVLKGLCARYGNGQLALAYYRSVEQGLKRVSAERQANPAIADPTWKLLKDLALRTDARWIHRQLNDLRRQGGSAKQVSSEITRQFHALEANPTPWRKYIPSFRWHGTDNQYHHWISGVLRGAFGHSWKDGQPVGQKIKGGLRWTLLLNLSSLLLAFGLAIPLGVFMARMKNRWPDYGLKILLFLLYALPSFWVATLLLLWAVNPASGLDWLRVLGTDTPQLESNWLEFFWHERRRVLLPILSLTYGSLAYIALQVRSAMDEVLEQDYIRTARAKGLPERKVLWRHAAKNAAFPLLTLIGSIFPALLAGSVVIESVFNIPGMGKLTLDAIFGQDWPLVYTVLWISGVLTVLGLLVSDILYVWLDPRIRSAEEKSKAVWT